MVVRTVGVEEELLLVDPTSRAAVPRSGPVLKLFRERMALSTGPSGSGRSEDGLDHELFRHQLEIQTAPCTESEELLDQLVGARRIAVEAAHAAEVRVVASGTAPISAGEPRVTRNDRYEAMVEEFGEAARSGTTCGMHVHVGIDSEEEGVEIIDRIAPWLPVVLALSANSPIANGRDSAYASWRSQVFSRWPSAGPTERFGSVSRYREVSRRMIEIGAARDPGMLYFNARLAQDYPTVEVRVADVTATPADAITLAALVRGLVSTVAVGPLPPMPAHMGDGAGWWSSELLRAAHWRAARHGLTGTLASPSSGRLLPARDVVEELLVAVRPALDEAGDAAMVHQGIEDLVRASGTSLQRSAYEREGSVEAVVDDLIDRTMASCGA